MSPCDAMFATFGYFTKNYEKPSYYFTCYHTCYLCELKNGGVSFRRLVFMKKKKKINGYIMNKPSF